MPASPVSPLTPKALLKIREFKNSVLTITTCRLSSNASLRLKLAQSKREEALTGRETDQSKRLTSGYS